MRHPGIPEEIPANLAEHHRRYGVPMLGELVLRLQDVEVPPVERAMLAGMAVATKQACIEGNKEYREAYEGVLGRIGATHETHAVRIGIEADLFQYKPIEDPFARLLSSTRRCLLDVYSRGFTTEQTAIILGVGAQAIRDNLALARRELRLRSLPNPVAVTRAYQVGLLRRGEV